MITKSRIVTLIAVVGALSVLMAIATFSSYRVSFSIEPFDSAAMAEGLNDISSTATPAPPTAPPTVTPVVLTATAVPSATPVSPTATDEVPTATAVLPTQTPVPPTAPLASPTPPIRTTFDDPTPVVVLPSATVVPTRVPGLPNVVIEKRASVVAARPGQTVVFVLTAHNTGTEAAHDVVVMDVVPDAFSIVDLQSSKGDIVVVGQTVTAYPSALAPGEQVIINITTTVRPDAEVVPQRNTAFITTSTPGDTPEDNTSTVTVQIAVPVQTKAPPTAKTITSVPVQMPNTADPDVPTLLMMWGPWIILAMFVLMFGVFVRFGMLRTRFVTVSLAGPLRMQDLPLPAPVGNLPPAQTPSIDLDAVALIAAWRSGASVGSLTQQVCNQNLHADRIVVGLAVQQIISDTLSQ